MEKEGDGRPAGAEGEREVDAVGVVRDDGAGEGDEATWAQDGLPCTEGGGRKGDR